MFFLLAVSQILSIIIILLSYGMIINSRKDINAAVYSQTELSVGFNKGASLSQIRKPFEKIFNQFDGRIERIIAIGYDSENEITIFMRFVYHHGAYYVDEATRDILLEEQINHTGRYYTDEELQNGEKVVVTGEYLADMDEVCMIGGEEYHVVGHFFEGGFSMSKNLEMPYLSANDNIQIDGLAITLKTLPTITEYNYFAKEMFHLFDYDCEVSLPEKFSNDTKYMYKTYIMIAVITLIMSVINIGMVYGYILKLRKRNNSVMSLCGGNNLSIAMINLLELMIICSCSYIAARMIFSHLIIPGLKDIFTYFPEIFNKYVFMDMFEIYMGAVIVAGVYNIIKILRKQIVDIIKM